MPSRTYRSLVRLYPRSFRTDYGEDLVQHFADLTADRGARAAWARTTVDLIVTVPRYRLESLMTEPHATSTISAAIVLCATGGVLSVLGGIYPGAVLLIVAAALVLARRGALARAIRTPGGNRRRNRLVAAGALALVCGAALVSYGGAIGDDHISGAGLLIHNAIGVPSMIGAIVFLVIGLLTPSTPREVPGQDRKPAAEPAAASRRSHVTTTDDASPSERQTRGGPHRLRSDGAPRRARLHGLPAQR